MPFDEPEDRPASAVPCLYWNDDFGACTAASSFSSDEITCYNEGECNGFGTCRGCSHYDQGGLKIGALDIEGGETQTPMNLQMFNVRAQIAPCCYWSGSPQLFYWASALSRAAPDFVPADEDPDPAQGEVRTSCSLAAAAPWQTKFTDENSSPYGCNGAKPECPYYTGPRFTEVVDAKMDLGNRITAKQVMELRYYSRKWSDITDPRAEWERLFAQPDIWAWARDTSSTTLPGAGLFDSTGHPRVQRVTIRNFYSETPQYEIGAPRSVAFGTPVIGGPPDYPTLIREISSLSQETLEVLWPPNTTDIPLVRQVFTAAHEGFWFSVLAHSPGRLVAINLARHPQNGEDAAAFVPRITRDYPEDVYVPEQTGLPGQTFKALLYSGGKKENLNIIRVFLERTGGDYLTADVYVMYKFYHAEVTQTRCSDMFGHTMIDPWVNHFTRLEAAASVHHVTNNTRVHQVLWNTIVSNGQKTMYAVEYQREVTSEDTSELEWTPLGCGYVAVEFKNPVINRVYPWKAWGTDSKDQPLYVKIDRTQNGNLRDDEPTEVELELAFASTAGTAIPANVAIFKVPTAGTARQRFDNRQDILRVRYAYTEYKQGPIQDEDLAVLKFPADMSNRVISQMPYTVTNTGTDLTVVGPRVRVGSEFIHSCDEVIGECFTSLAQANELLAQASFKGGGVNDDQVLTHTEMVSACANEFNEKHAGKLFEDGTPVTFTETVNRVAHMYLLEGSQHYLVVVADESGRPVGAKQVAFLAQSALAQARDVEIRYKWVAPAQHWPIQHPMFLLAYATATMHTEVYPLLHIMQPYDPVCGDHQEGTNYHMFDIADDAPGALWYPYKQCLRPRYNVGTRSSRFDSPVSYEDTVEGFADNYEGLRRDYWEKARFWDRYTPAVVWYIPQIGCYWSESTTTVNIEPPAVFLGYTKIRSFHPYGPYNVDREVLRLSRHWEKRNLNFETETATQEDGGYTYDLTNSFRDSLYDDSGALNTGSATQTPVWVHINDGYSVVSPATEDRVHPFAHLLLERVGDHVFNEQFDSTRVTAATVFTERDLTSSQDRTEDGSQVYSPDTVQINTEDGATLAEDTGRDIRWVYSASNTAWAWVASPPEPERGSTRVTGVFISNPRAIYFKENRMPATFAEEGPHSLKYTPHTFDDDGELLTSATLALDNGPPLRISLVTGNPYILASDHSPYDSLEHTGEDYVFGLFGAGPSGFGVLADDRGLQRFSVQGEKRATLAGVVVGYGIDIDELPYVLRDVRQVPRLADVVEDVFDGLEKVFDTTDVAEKDTGVLDLKGHYYVEEVTVDFRYGQGSDETALFDVPLVEVTAYPYSPGASVDVLSFSSGYARGVGVALNTGLQRAFRINRRLEQLSIHFGQRRSDAGMEIRRIYVRVREPMARTEQIYLYEPRFQISRGSTGTHKPSDLEFYFERTVPDFARNYLAGTLSLSGDLFTQEITAIPAVEVKYSTRRVRDLVPYFDFTDLEGGRFPYNNIEVSAIPGYVEEATGAGTYRYIEGAVQTCSKGWTMYTTTHEEDPGDNLAHPNSFDGRLYEEGQEYLYQAAGELLGDKIAVYQGFWHPDEVSFFADRGVDITTVSWTLTLRSTVAPLARVFRHEDYGCVPSVTSELNDGLTHNITPWQARGVFHYSCDPAWNWTCFHLVMNKCNDFFFKEYGTSLYLDNDVVGRYGYPFIYPPSDSMAYINAGLIDKNYTGGHWGGFSPTSLMSATAGQSPFAAGGMGPNPYSFYQTAMQGKGPGPYQ